ncbi:MAG: chemotaxis-specific protein-glutamate methyltransferase CheB [bacterium]|nr:chemotaxis-specific protein-glutamate methyltransferase CheB [bacterium]
MNPTIRVLIVENSDLMRSLYVRLLAQNPAIEVAGEAKNLAAAREMTLSLRPDVILLQIQMLDEETFTFLKSRMALSPIPVIALGAPENPGNLPYAECGVVGFLRKPVAIIGMELALFRDELIQEIQSAAHPHPDRGAPAAAFGGTVVAIGSSTGGTEALRSILSRLPATFPPIVIVQHMAAHFIGLLANSLDSLSPLSVQEARPGDRLRPGNIYLAPGDLHMTIRKIGGDYEVRLQGGPKVWGCRPSIDLLFESVAQSAGKNAVGVILTGMGRDGARGLAQMKSAGAATFAQDEESSVVFGMPKEAIKAGGVDKVVGLADMPRQRQLAIPESLARLHPREFPEPKPAVALRHPPGR